MSKFTCLVLCVVAVSLTKVNANEEGKAAFHKAIKPIIDECSKEHGVSTDEIKSAKEAGSADGIKPCFIGCVLKKAGILNSKGEFDLETGLEKLKTFVKNDEEYNKLADVGKQCVSVNDEDVKDGEAGCERGTRLVACFLEHKGEIPI